MGSRTFSSATTCAAAAPYVECRVVTGLLGSERLVPGDAIRVSQPATLTGAGDNLRGTLTFDATTLVNQAPSASQLSRTATVTLSVTRPDGSAAPVTGAVSTNVVDRAAAGGFGTYQAVATIAVPAADAAARWDTALWSQVLDLDTVKVTFTQTT